MKKKSIKSLNLKKTNVSNLHLLGGATDPNGNNAQAAATGKVCLNDSRWCNASNFYSCYSPCGGTLATVGCAG